MAHVLISPLTYAAATTLLDENYDALSVGASVPGWTVNSGGAVPYVQNTRFSSGSRGAAIQSDFGTYRLFPSAASGIVTVEIWMNPKVGSDTNSGLRLGYSGSSGYSDIGIVFKNDTDQWFYSSNGQSIPFANVDGSGHRVKVVFDTSSWTYDFDFDGTRVATRAQASSSLAGSPLTGVGIWSGRGGAGTVSYFDDLRVTVETTAAACAGPTGSGTTILDENYDSLSVGASVSGWTVNPGGAVPYVQSASSCSGASGAAIQSDFGTYRLFPSAASGIVTVEIWMNPKVGSDTNSGLRLGYSGSSGYSDIGIVFKNDTDQWFYSSNGQSIPFANVDGSGHRVKVVFDTSSWTYDFDFDGTRVATRAQASSSLAGSPLTGVGIWSGRGGAGTVSYFDDLKVTLTGGSTPPVTGGTGVRTAARDDCLFNWAESAYSSLFRPSGAQSITFGTYYFRYYSQTDSYLGTSSSNNHLYYIGVLSANALLDVGDVFDWYRQAGC